MATIISLYLIALAQLAISVFLWRLVLKVYNFIDALCVFPFFILIANVFIMFMNIYNAAIRLDQLLQ